MLKSVSLDCMEVCVTYTFVTTSICPCLPRVLSRFVHSLPRDLPHSRARVADRVKEGER